MKIKEYTGGRATEDNLSSSQRDALARLYEAAVDTEDPWLDKTLGEYFNSGFVASLRVLERYGLAYCWEDTSGVSHDAQVDLWRITLKGISYVRTNLALDNE